MSKLICKRKPCEKSLWRGDWQDQGAKTFINLNRLAVSAVGKQLVAPQLHPAKAFVTRSGQNRGEG